MHIKESPSTVSLATVTKLGRMIRQALENIK